MEKEEVLRQLPKVGDKRMECPTIDESTGCNATHKPQSCKVIEVNTEHLWYRVEFENGIRETYKVPKVKTGPNGGLL